MTLPSCLSRWGAGIALAFTLSVASAVDTSTVAVPKLDWQPCADFPNVECATAYVPLDYDAPQGAKTYIALARLKAADPARRIGTLFLNPGGPGGAGRDLVFFGFADAMQVELKGRFDIVGFDPRGVGGSDPIHCFASPEEELDYLNSQFLFPWEREQQRPYFDHFNELPKRCFALDGRIARHMSTADVARDLELLRRAVGDDRLNYFGFSYGSYLGSTYANLYRHNIRAMVIDGVLDARLFSSGAQIAANRTDTAEVVEEFLRLCDEAGDNCALSGGGRASERYWQLVRTLRDHPIDLGEGFFYWYDFLIADTTSVMYSPEVWASFAEFLDVLALTANGDTRVAPTARSLRRSIMARLAQPEADYPNGYESFYGNHCADVQYPQSFAAFSRIDEYAEDGSIFGPYWWWGFSPCARWPVAADRYTGPWSTTTSKPVLVVGNFFDPATGYRSAVATSKLLRNSRLLSYAGWGHTATLRNACVTSYVAKYLLNGALPKPSTVCAANPSPFEPATLARGGARAPLIGLPAPGRGMPPERR